MNHYNIFVIFFFNQAKQVSEEPNAPYRTVDNFKELTTTLFKECETVDDLFTRAVGLYGPNECLGTRELLSEEDELQKNGKVFKKVGSSILVNLRG